MGEKVENDREGEEYTRAELVGVYGVVVRSGGAEYSQGAVMLLKGEDWEKQILPIYIGRSEAESIARAFYGVPTQRPMTHDLIVSILGALGVRVERITIDALINNVYTATIVLLHEENSRVRRYYIDARPSDSVAIAVRTGAPIYVNRQLRKYAQSESSFTDADTPYER
ncbi:MAG: bifunctional nuclease family protein [Thermofilaceae archaeon]